MPALFSSISGGIASLNRPAKGFDACGIGFMSGKKTSVSRLSADFELKSCRRLDGDKPAGERRDTAG
jgi:hypothetical protein